jgi:hypothetical protein
MPLPTNRGIVFSTDLSVHYPLLFCFRDAIGGLSSTSPVRTEWQAPYLPYSGFSAASCSVRDVDWKIQKRDIPSVQSIETSRH